MDVGSLDDLMSDESEYVNGVGRSTNNFFLFPVMLDLSLLLDPLLLFYQTIELYVMITFIKIFQ